MRLSRAQQCLLDSGRAGCSCGQLADAQLLCDFHAGNGEGKAKESLCQLTFEREAWPRRHSSITWMLSLRGSLGLPPSHCSLGKPFLLRVGVGTAPKEAHKGLSWRLSHPSELTCKAEESGRHSGSQSCHICWHFACSRMATNRFLTASMYGLRGGMCWDAAGTDTFIFSLL